MKKDIHIPKVSGVFMCVTNEYNDVYKTDDWNVYIVNEKSIDLEMVLIVSYGYDNEKSTSKMRHKIEKLPANSYAKVELIQPEIFDLNNEFKVSFFSENQLFEKSYLLPKNTAKEENLKQLKVLNKQGILLK